LQEQLQAETPGCFAEKEVVLKRQQVSGLERTTELTALDSLAVLARLEAVLAAGLAAGLVAGFVAVRVGAAAVESTVAGSEFGTRPAQTCQAAESAACTRWRRPAEG